jgi:hypothetical protein
LSALNRTFEWSGVDPQRRRRARNHIRDKPSDAVDALLVNLVISYLLNRSVVRWLYALAKVLDRAGLLQKWIRIVIGDTANILSSG